MQYTVRCSHTTLVLLYLLLLVFQVIMTRPGNRQDLISKIPSQLLLISSRDPYFIQGFLWSSAYGVEDTAPSLPSRVL